MEYLTLQSTSLVAGPVALCVRAAVVAWIIRVPCSPSVRQQASCHWQGPPVAPPPLSEAGDMSSSSMRTLPGLVFWSP